MPHKSSCFVALLLLSLLMYEPVFGEQSDGAPPFCTTIDSLKKRAEAGAADTQYQLAWCYQYGKGIPQDMRQAMILFRKAADAGHVEALVTLGVKYLHGFGVDKDYSESAKWLQMARTRDTYTQRLNLR